MSRVTAASEIVLLGTGAAHLEVLRRFALRPPWRARLTVVGPAPDIPRPGTLPGLIRGDLTVSEACVDLGRLCMAAGARLILAAPVGLDLAARTVALAGRPPLAFDVLSVDLAGESVVFGTDSTNVPLYPLAAFPDRLAKLEAALPDAARLAVVGGGSTAPELVLALAQRWRGRLRLVLVSDTPEPLAAAPVLARRAVREALVAAGVELASAVHAGPLAAGRLALSDGTFLQADAALWAGETRPPAFLADAGLACDAHGRILVAPTQRSVSHATVFAAGESVTPAEPVTPVEPTTPEPESTKPVRSPTPAPDRFVAALLVGNLRRAAFGREPGRPMLSWLKPPAAPGLIELGPGRAVAWSNRVAVAGEMIAHARAWLIRWQMRRYARRLPSPSLPAQRHPGDRFTAPIAPAAASIALPVLPRVAAPDAVVAPSVPNSVAMTPPPGHGIVQTIACLPSYNFPDLFLFGQIAAAHVLSEQCALAVRPWTALAIASVPGDPSDARMRADLADMLAGAEAVLAGDGWALAGGHAGAAAELSLGFAVSGLIDPAQLARRRRLRPGDALLLTKPLGTGIVLAGHARGEARAAWMHAAADVMRSTNTAAARMLRAHGMSACAAVNGAGLGGHLDELLRAAGVAAVLWPDSVPLLPGTMELLSAANAGRSRERRLSVQHSGDGGTFAALLADPQVSGGLIAGVPPARAEACLSLLRTEGLQAAMIGVVEEAEDGGPLIRLERR